MFSSSSQVRPPLFGNFMAEGEGSEGPDETIGPISFRIHSSGQ